MISRLLKFIKKNPFQTVLLAAMLGYFGVYAYTGTCPLRLTGDTLAGSDGGAISEEAAAFNLFDSGMELQLIDGTILNTESLRGKATVVNYWATWCGPCVREIPAFNKIYSEQSDQVQFIGISVDSEIATVERFLQRTTIDYPLVHADMRFSMLTGPVRSIPLSLFFDSEGQYAGKVVGSMSERRLAKKIASL